MSDTIEKINWLFPYQVALALNEWVSPDVLDWVYARLDRADMYVDLNDQVIRYCFLEASDAVEFSRLFASRKAG